MIRPEPPPDRELQALRALDDMRRRSPEAVREETLRVKAKLVELYGWEGYQRVLARMESDLARLERSVHSHAHRNGCRRTPPA